jgi:hypothetical protein
VAGHPVPIEALGVVAGLRQPPVHHGGGYNHPELHRLHVQTVSYSYLDLTFSVKFLCDAGRMSCNNRMSSSICG